MMKLISIQKDSTIGTIGGQRNTSACFLDLDLHTTNNFAPNEYRGVVNSSGLVVYKGSKARDKKY